VLPCFFDFFLMGEFVDGLSMFWLCGGGVDDGRVTCTTKLKSLAILHVKNIVERFALF
jgi:hypothetical protein